MVILKWLQNIVLFPLHSQRLSNCIDPLFREMANEWLSCNHSTMFLETRGLERTWKTFLVRRKSGQSPRPKCDHYSTSTTTFSIPLKNVQSTFRSFGPYQVNLNLAAVLENLTRELRDTRIHSYTTPPVVEAVPFMLPQAPTHSSCTTVAMETNHSVLHTNPSAFQLGAVSNCSKSSSALPGSREASFKQEHKIPVKKN